MARKTDSAGASKPKRKTAGRPRKAKPAAPRPLRVDEIVVPMSEEMKLLAQAVIADGGMPLAYYREPYGGHDVFLVALPLSKVEPTPFQRDVSPAHVKKLARSIEKVGRFLDPVLAVRSKDGYWVPNGGHRLAALKEAGATTVTALLVPEPEVAHKILALNTEKAHNLKERALEVVRLERLLVGMGEKRPEAAFELELEEGSLVTLGLAYELRPRLAGGAYSPLLRRVDPLSPEPLPATFARREKLARQLLEADDVVTEIVVKLKERGFKSPYIRPFVVARVNPVHRFVKTLPASAEEALEKLLANAKKFNVERVKESDVAASGGPPPSDGEEG